MPWAKFIRAAKYAVGLDGMLFSSSTSSTAASTATACYARIATCQGTEKRKRQGVSVADLAVVGQLRVGEPAHRDEHVVLGRGPIRLSSFVRVLVRILVRSGRRLCLCRSSSSRSRSGQERILVRVVVIVAVAVHRGAAYNRRLPFPSCRTRHPAGPPQMLA